MENYYDYGTGRWVTASDRYHAVADQSPCRELLDWDYAEDPATEWRLILELLAAVPEDTIGFVGGGPLETFVNRHAEAFIDQLETELPRNERLRRAVIEVYLEEGCYPPDIEARIVSAFGPRFWLLPRTPTD